MHKFLILFFLGITFYSCKKEDNSPVYNAKDTATLEIVVTSNQRYPLYFFSKNFSVVESLNLSGFTDSVPLKRTYKVGKGLYECSAWLMRDTANIYFNMVDSNPAWIKIEAFVDGKKITEGMGEPIPGNPEQLVSSIFVDY